MRNFISQKCSICYCNFSTNIIAPISTIAIALATLFGDGLAAFFSLNLGQGNTDKAAQGVGTAVIASSIISMLYAVAAFVFLSPLCRIFGATNNIIPYALGYGHIIVIGFPFAIVATVINSAIRTDGSPRYAMFSMMVGAILNTILDPIFIFAFQWGVEGAALATILSQFVGLFLTLLICSSLRLLSSERIRLFLGGLLWAN